MVVSRRLPPSERDFQLYRTLVIEGTTTYDTAKIFKISQTRVRQLQRKVVDWAAEILPPETEAKTANLLRVTQIAASERMEQAFSDAIDQWRRTNQPKCLNMVLRVIESEVKLQLPARAGMLESLLERFEEELHKRYGDAEEQASLPEEAEADAAEQTESDSDPAGADDAMTEANATAEAAFAAKATAAAKAIAITPSAEDCSTKAPPRTGVVEPPKSPKRVTRPRTSKLDTLLADDPFWKAEQDERLRTLLRPAEARERS